MWIVEGAGMSESLGQIRLAFPILIDYAVKIVIFYIWPVAVF